MYCECYNYFRIQTIKDLINYYIRKRCSKVKVFFKGFYGFKNLGDDIFVHTIEWFCKKNEIDYMIHGYNLPYGVKGKNINNKFQKNLLDLFFTFRAHKIIYWGGSTFEDISKKTDLKNFISRFNFLTDKVLLFSISLGPFKNKIEEDKVINFVKKLKYVGVRDKKSLTYSDNLTFTFDLAILSPLIFKTKAVKKITYKNKKTISLNISNAANFNDYTQIYLTYLIKNKDDINIINILVFNPDDYKKSRDIYIELKRNNINCALYNYTRNTKKLVNLISNSDLLLGNRLHSGILAYAYDVPFILNEYHSKCTEFLNTINQDFRINNLNNSKFDLDHTIKQCNQKITPIYFQNITLAELKNLKKAINNND